MQYYGYTVLKKCKYEKFSNSTWTMQHSWYDMKKMKPPRLINSKRKFSSYLANIDGHILLLVGSVAQS